MSTINERKKYFVSIITYRDSKYQNPDYAYDWKMNHGTCFDNKVSAEKQVLTEVTNAICSKFWDQKDSILLNIAAELKEKYLQPKYVKDLITWEIFEAGPK